jgi:hypothetical protein
VPGAPTKTGMGISFEELMMEVRMDERYWIAINGPTCARLSFPLRRVNDDYDLQI